MSEYVTIELAKKLKEKGFPQGNKDDITEKYYTISDSLTSNDEETKCDCTTLSQIATLCYARVSADERWYCPTIAQVLKWLREQDIMVEIIPSLVDDGTWTFSFRIQTNKFYDRSTKDYDSYESSALACIEYILNDLI